MAFAPIPEYEGKSPYVFITYAQQDEKIAYSIAVKMYNEGFRIWSSAACGNPSNMRIAERLSNSAVAMVFLSKSYLQYASYKEFEPRAVMNSPKQKIVVCLDDTPIGTDWNTVDFPAGIRYNPDIPQELWLRINSSDALEKCRGAWPRNPLPLPFEEMRVVNVEVDEDELSDELADLNSVMSSFGVGLDEREMRGISLFNRGGSDADQLRWQEQQSQRSQEQEYYAIENLIDNSPMPDDAEQQQYDSMIGLIDSFAEKSKRAKEEELRRKLNPSATEAPVAAPPVVTPSTDTAAAYSYGEYRPVPKNEFHRVDLTKDISSAPVVITESSDINTDRKSMVIDYGDSEVADYSMTRRRTSLYYPSDEGQSSDEEQDKEPEPVVSAPAEAAPAPVAAPPEPQPVISVPPPIAVPEPQPPAPKPEPVAPPARFLDDDIPQPALRFERREPPKPATEEPQVNRRHIVSVRTRVRRTEYENEMYEVNGRWIPGEIYHRLMPNAKYTMVRRISRPQVSSVPQSEPPQPSQPLYRPSRPRLGSDSRLHSAVNTFFTPSRPSAPPTESIPEPVRSALRERHEQRRMEAIRQLEEAAEPVVPARTAYKAAPAADEDNAPARKHKFSHEGGIKKSLTANMESPVDTSAEESHRQFGTRAAINNAAGENAETEKSDKKSKKKEEEKAAKKAAQKAAEKAARKEAQKKAAQKKAEEEKKNKKKKSSKSSANEDAPVTSSRTRSSFRMPRQPEEPDDDSLLEMPRRNLPNVQYDPEVYRDMNLSEILFGQSGDKKKKKK